MKRIISMFLCGVLLFFCGCSSKKTPEKVEIDILNEYLNNINKFETTSREFGTTSSLIQMETGMSVCIFYPNTGYVFLDEEIANWIEGLSKKYITEMKGKTDETSELSVNYNSYLVGESVVSIKMEGTYFSSYMAHPIDIIKTFNADIKKCEFMGIKDIISDNQYKYFEELAILKADVENVDEHFFDNLVITKTGIEIILKCGDYFPMSEGSKSVVLKYDEIEGLLVKSFDYKTNKAEAVDGDISIIKETKETEIDPSAPMLALTFDDGPSANTERILDVLNQYGGKATFFVLGNRVNVRKNTMIRIVNEGHEIGNHSWSHRQLTHLTSQEIKDQIMMTRAKIYEVTGKDCLIVRPPYGLCNDVVKEIGKNLGVTFVNWSVDTLDWKTKDAQAIYNEVMKSVSDGAIILCHDLYKTTVEAIETVVPKLIDDGYQLVTVSKLLEYSDKNIEFGKVYYRQ